MLPFQAPSTVEAAKVLPPPIPILIALMAESALVAQELSYKPLI